MSTPLWLYRIQPVRPGMLLDAPTPEEAQVVSEHFAYLQHLTEAGVVLLAGRTQTTDYASFGICIFRAASQAEAQQIVDADPAVRGRVMRAELFPYRIGLLGRFEAADTP